MVDEEGETATWIMPWWGIAVSALAVGLLTGLAYLLMGRWLVQLTGWSPSGSDCWWAVQPRSTCGGGDGNASGSGGTKGVD